MPLDVLAREEPVEAFWAEKLGNVFAGSGEGVDGECGVPSGEVGVDGPGAVGAGGVDEELDAFADDFVCLRGLTPPARQQTCQTHNDEAGERCSFEVAAAVGLHVAEHFQATADGEASDESCDWIL